MPSPPHPSSPDDGPAGPEVSDASLRAALAHERVHAEELRALADFQGALLRRRPVRMVLSADRRVRRARDRARQTGRRGRRRTARAHLTLRALLARRTVPERQRDLDAAREAIPAAPGTTATVTLLVVADATGRVPAVEPAPHETIVVLCRPDATAPDDPDVTVVRATHKTEVAAVRDAARRATGELLCIVRSTTVPCDSGWLAHLADAVEGPVVVAVPQVVHPARDVTRATPHDLRIRHLGLEVAPTRGGEPEVRARGAGGRPDPERPVVEVAAGTSAGIVVRRDRWAEADGPASLDDLDAAVFDLCARLRAGQGRVVAVPAAMVVDERPAPSFDSLAHPISDRGSSWQRVRARQGVTMERMAARRSGTDNLRVVTTIAAPSSRVAHRWGDLHLAEGLAAGLRRLGHVVQVRTLDQAGERTDAADVHLVLRGTAPVARVDERCQVLWIISHPEAVTVAECDEADLVLVASESFAADLRSRTSTPVEVLLQGTDTSRFTPRAPDPRHTHAVAAVAMTRHVFRPSVRLAIESGLRPAIYGGGWEEFVDPDLVVARFVANHRLPAVYSSVGVLLNDHWETMRRWGFVSNRLFDALACGTPIVSDHLPELTDLFGDAVSTFLTADDLRAAVDDALGDPEAARRRAAAGRELVVAHHSLAHRAVEMVDALGRHDLVAIR